MTPGAGAYTIQGIDFDHATPLLAPPMVSALGIGLEPGELDMAFAMIYGLDISEGITIAQLNDLVRPEDLQLMRLK
jgi:hypothetical protein